MSMRRAEIINFQLFFSTKRGVENLLSSTQVLLRSNEVFLA